VATRAILAWSGGKDSALALQQVRQAGTYLIEGLLTTITKEHDRVCMHGVRTALLDRQAQALGLPVDKIELDAHESQEGYDAKMQACLADYRRRGIGTVVFGDLFLQDVRQYRQTNLSRVDMQAAFPLWQQDTRALARTFMETGFKAVITCVDLQALPLTFLGREYDRTFLADLPAGVDPCGENGEFHSFVHDGPLFRAPIAFERGCTITRENRFAYIDLIPTTDTVPQAV
jgi:uncharacterized protein (TIGR00290 family)